MLAVRVTRDIENAAGFLAATDAWLRPCDHPVLTNMTLEEAHRLLAAGSIEIDMADRRKPLPWECEACGATLYGSERLCVWCWGESA